MILPGDLISEDFTTQDTSGAAVDADSLPTAVLVRNGTDTAETVTVTNKATGVYNFEFTIPAGWNSGDDLQVRIEALIATTPAKEYVWSASLDSEPTVDVVPGLTTTTLFEVDRYGTPAEADVYFATKLYVEPWESADPDQQDKALYEATRMIDRLRFRYSKTDEDQQLEFPRNGDTEVPVQIKYACFEIALALLDGVDPDLEHQNLAISSDGYSSVRATYNRTTAPEHFQAGIPSRPAWLFLRPFLVDVRALKLRRV